MESAGERLSLLQGGACPSILPLRKSLELRQQFFLRDTGALARPTQKLGIDGDADHWQGHRSFGL